MNKLNRLAQRGFTLIELLVVVGVLAVLLAIVLIAINPARQFSQANNTKRSSDVNALLNAIHQYAADNKGTLPGSGSITTSVLNISSTAVNLCSDLVPQYIAALPVDPLTNNGTPVTDCASAYDTNYTVVRSASDNRVTITAPAAELGASISVVR